MKPQHRSHRPESSPKKKRSRSRSRSPAGHRHSRHRGEERSGGGGNRSLKAAHMGELGLSSGSLGAELQKVVGGEKRRTVSELHSAQLKKSKSFSSGNEPAGGSGSVTGTPITPATSANSIKTESTVSTPSPSFKTGLDTTMGSNAADATLKDELSKSLNYSEVKKVSRSTVLLVFGFFYREFTIKILVKHRNTLNSKNFHTFF
jgi:hypothetical protein